MKFFTRAALLLIMATVLSCDILAHAQTKIRETTGLVYRNGANSTDAEKALCQLDVYAPQNAANLPVLVWFHGGGFTGGDKATRLTSALCRALASEGFVVASANYRLNPAVKYPTYLEDGAAAVAWMRQNAALLGGNGANLFVGGHSAGGFLAAMLGTDARFLQPHGLALSDLAGVIPLSGEMTTHFTILKERGLAEGTILVDEAAPLFHAAQTPNAQTPKTPPFLLMWGENDLPTRAEQNQFFAAALRASGNERVQSLEIPERDHGGTISKMAQDDDPVRRAIVAFLNTHQIR